VGWQWVDLDACSEALVILGAQRTTGFTTCLENRAAFAKASKLPSGKQIHYHEIPAAVEFPVYADN